MFEFAWYSKGNWGTVPYPIGITCCLTNIAAAFFSIVTARVLSYDIPQGDEYEGIIWKDIRYSRPEANNGLLSGGTGCLTENLLPTNPFIEPECWIGWNKENVSNPAISLLLTRKTVIKGLYFYIYVNESMGAFTFSNMTISAEDIFKGKVCAPRNYYNISAQGKGFNLKFENIYAQKLTINFNYAGNWILIRRIKVLQKGE